MRVQRSKDVGEEQVFPRRGTTVAVRHGADPWAPEAKAQISSGAK